ncbi:MAG: glycine betaine ABC transporter substrate-binding protein [Bacteroidota bacterium]
MSQKITLGVTNLSFHRVTAALITKFLQKMGFEVERTYAPHETNFQRLMKGEVDALISAWLPSSHGGYKEKVQKEVPLMELGFHYSPYALWGVSEYVPSDLVIAVEDLLKPEVIDQMKSSIQGINLGAGITRFSIKMMEAYGLNDAGYQFHTGTEKDCFESFEHAVANNEWIIVPLWKPQFLHYKYTIRELKEPKGLLGTVDKAVLLLREDKKFMFSQTQLDQLDAIQFSNEVIAALDYKVSREGRDIDKVADGWLKENQLHDYYE